jgi:hypothetical protein
VSDQFVTITGHEEIINQLIIAAGKLPKANHLQIHAIYSQLIRYAD